MSAVPTARIGDVCTHGAVIITGSFTRTINGIPSVRLGDLVACPIPGHGVNPIIAVTTVVITEGLPTVKFSAVAACGAVVISGSDNVLTG